MTDDNLQEIESALTAHLDQLDVLGGNRRVGEWTLVANIYDFEDPDVSAYAYIDSSPSMRLHTRIGLLNIALGDSNTPSYYLEDDEE